MMRSPCVPLIAIAIVGLAACAPTPAQTARTLADAAADQARVEQRLAGLVPGKPQSCVDEYQIRDAQLSSYGNTILYSLNSRQVYRTDTSGLCRDVGGGGHNILVTRIHSSQLCQNDIATTIDSTSRFPTGSCSFGPFVRYAKP